jgi:hypothetical protein
MTKAGIDAIRVQNKKYLETITELAAKLKIAIEALEYYSDSTNFEAVDEGRNYHSEWVVEEYNKIMVCGQPIGMIAKEALERLK